MKAAFVDVGSNSIRVMTAISTSAALTFSNKTIFTTRLASGMEQTHVLSMQSMQLSLSVLKSIASDARENGLPVFVYATNAVRDAVNGAQFISHVFDKTGLRINVLSGAEEARLALIGATHGSGALLDIGGGSVQLISPTVSYSAPCGCVRAKDRYPSKATPEDALRLIQPWLTQTFRPPSITCEKWTGVGGTITTLAAYDLGLKQYDACAVSNHYLSEVTVERLLSELNEMGKMRQSHPLLLARHDVILPGGAVLLHIMRQCGIPTLRVSDADGLEGYAIQILTNNGKGSTKQLP